MQAAISTIVPFLKWAGGKRWLISSQDGLFPNEFGRYYEPFLGSAAVFFRLKPTKATLSDTNADLIDCYVGIRDSWQKVEELLRLHQFRHSQTYYEGVRASRPASIEGKAARFVYLNRTCWNALYRVNLKGEFNVPIGTKTNVLLGTDDFEAVAKRLKRVTLAVCDFEALINRARSGDLVFADPPYTVKHNFNGFVKYNEKIFRWEDQVRLSKCLQRASSRGVQVLSTNANHPSIVDLYRGHFTLLPVTRRSVIAADRKFRGYYEELIIKNY